MEILIIVDNKRIGGHSNIRDDEEWVAVFFVGNETYRAPWSSPLVYNSEAYWILVGSSNIFTQDIVVIILVVVARLLL
jgi:hypothetical protein